MITLTNSEDPDEMPHNVVFHRGLHCLLRQKQSSEKGIKYYSEIISCDPSLEYIQWTILMLLYQTRKNPLVHKRLMKGWVTT